jgi:Flp pilus assembly pilin Flp
MRLDMMNQNPQAIENAPPEPHRHERGASLVEYALLVALIAIIAIVAVRELGETTHNQFAGLVTHLGGNPIRQFD